MNDVIAIGDEVRLRNGSTGVIEAIQKYRGLYLVGAHIVTRDEFQPVKWEAAKVCSTGLGVCAQGASGQ